MLWVNKNQIVKYIILITEFLITGFILTLKFVYFWMIQEIGYVRVVSDIFDCN